MDLYIVVLMLHIFVNEYITEAVQMFLLPHRLIILKQTKNLTLYVRSVF